MTFYKQKRPKSKFRILHLHLLACWLAWPDPQTNAKNAVIDIFFLTHEKYDLRVQVFFMLVSVHKLRSFLYF